MLSLVGKKVAVIGLGKRTGVAVAKKLYELGAEVIVSDIKESSELEEEISMLADCEVDYDLGGHGEKSLEAELIVVSPGVPLDIPFFSKVKEKNIPVISEIELAYYLTDARIVAITGTNGKTTTTRLLGNILKNSNVTEARVAGNIGTPLIQEVEKLSEDDWLVVEVSSFQLETITNFRPDIAIYLNFSPDHLDRHKSKKEYWLAKKKIFANQRSNDFAILNFDDLQVIKAARDCQAKKYGLSMGKKLNSGAYLENNKIIISLNDKEEVIYVDEIPLQGKHNIFNVAFAALAARIIGVEVDIIKEQIKLFTPEAHRLQRIDNGNEEIIIYDDSKATNTDAAIKALLSFTRPVVLIAGGQDRNADFSDLAEIIDERVKTLILLGETRNKIADSVLKEGFSNIYMVEDMEEAVQEAIPKCNKGDCLLLSPGCPSWDMYSSYRERGNDYRDCLIKVGYKIERRKHT